MTEKTESIPLAPYKTIWGISLAGLFLVLFLVWLISIQGPIPLEQITQKWTYPDATVIHPLQSIGALLSWPEEPDVHQKTVLRLTGQSFITVHLSRPADSSHTGITVSEIRNSP